MAKITVISGHPRPEASLANRNVLEKFHELIPDAEIIWLAQTYPDAKFDVRKEQERLAATESIVFQFPVWWYAAPWLLQKYITDVLAYGYAYGDKYALEGKKFVLSLTCGGGEKSYTRDGLYHCTIEEIMSPLHALARYCRLDYLGQAISYHMMPDDCPVNEIIEKARTQGEKLAKMLGK